MLRASGVAAILVSVSLLVSNPARAQSTWTGTGTAVWTDPLSWSAGVPAAGVDAVFAGAAPGTITLGGADVGAAGMNLSFTAGGYTLNPTAAETLTFGNLSHATGTNTLASRLVSAGTHTVSGGTLRLTNTALGGGANNFTGANFAVATGATLDVAFGGVRPASPGPSGSSALGTADVTLNGGTLLLNGANYNDAAGGLTLQIYAQQTTRNARVEFGNGLAGVTSIINTSTPETLAAPNAGFTNAVTNVNQQPVPANSAAFAPQGLSTTDNVMAFWKGKFFAPTGGTYQFGTRSDDGSVIYLNGSLLVNNNNFQGQTNVNTSITLTAGYHDILIGYYEGTGDNVMLAYESNNIADPLDLNDFVAAQPMTTLGNNVTLTESSTIAASNTYGVTMGTLTSTAAAEGDTLTIGRTGMLDGIVRFTGTNLSAVDAITFNTISDLAVGQLNDGGNALVITKTGNGNLILDHTATASTTANTNINVLAGQLIVQRTNTGNNPLGTGTVNLNGANTTLQLNLIDSTGGNTAFLNNINVNANATLMSVNHNTSSRTVLVGGISNSINVAAGATLTVVATTNAPIQFDGSITGGGNVLVSMLSDAGNTQAIVNINRAATYSGSTTIASGAQLQLNVADAIDGSKNVIVQNGGGLRLNVAGALDSTQVVQLQSGGRVDALAANTWDANAGAAMFDGTGSIYRVSNSTAVAADLTLRAGRVLEINVNGLTGTGTIRRAPAVTVTVLNGSGNHLDGAQFPASSIKAFDLVRMGTNNTAEGTGVVATGIAATQAGAIIEINGANRSLAAGGGTQVINGQIISSDTTRELSDAGRLDIGAKGATFASQGTLTVRENIVLDAPSGKLVFGSNIALGGATRNGTVVLTNTANSFNHRVQNAVDIIGGTILAAEANTTGTTAVGSDASAHLGINLYRGTFEARQGTTANNSYLVVGQVNIMGQGALRVARGAAGLSTEMRLDDAFTRSNRGTLALVSANNVLGTEERVVFVTPSEAPARLVSSSATTMNVVAPYILNTSGTNTANFVDYDQSGTSGFTNVTYTAFTGGNLTGSTDTTIANVTTAAVTLAGTQTVGLLRTDQSISGGTLVVDRGGIIMHTTGRTITSAVQTAAGVELVVYSAATSGTHAINGTITSDSGLTKWGATTLGLGGNNAATLVGDITVNQGLISVGTNNNALGEATNRLIFNGGGVRMNTMTLSRNIVINEGGGDLQTEVAGTVLTQGAGVNISGAGTLNVTGNAAGGVVVLTQANTFEGGLIIGSNGTVRFGADNQLGAAAVDAASLNSTNYDTGHVMLNGGELELASNSGTVTVERQFTVRANSNIDVAGANDRLVLARDLRDSGQVTKVGAGTLVLANADGSGQTGNYVVNGGTLLANNTNLAFAANGSGNVTVNSGATLGGTGSLDGVTTVSSGGFIRAGDATVNSGHATLTFHSSVTLNAGSAIEFSIGGVTATNTVNTEGGTLAYESYVASQADTWNGTTVGPGTHDVIAGTQEGAVLTVNGTLRVLTASNGFTLGDVFDLLDWSGTFSGLDLGSRYTTGGVVGDLDLPTLNAGLQWDTGLFQSHGILMVVGMVPEPGRAMLVVFGLATCLLRRRRRAPVAKGA